MNSRIYNKEIFSKEIKKLLNQLKTQERIEKITKLINDWKDRGVKE